MGIKVPSNYSSSADIIKDLRDMADSIEKEFARKDEVSNVDVPTKTSDLENDSGFINNAVNDLLNYYLKSEIYTKEEVNSLIGAITTMNIQKVDALPTENISTTTIYFVPKTNAKTQDIYDEYVYINKNWEHIGSTEIDLTGYATEEWVNIQIADFLSEGEVSTLIDSALENYYNKTEIDSELTKRDAEIAELKEENKVLKSQIPNGEAEGESITLEDSARDLEIEDLEIRGNTYQETREGYNLFNADREFPFTQNGLTFSKNEDGSIVINGTCTANMNANVSMGYNQEQQEVMSGKEYAFQIKTVGTGRIAGFGLKHSGNSDRFTVPLTNAGIFQKTAVYTKRDTDTGSLYWTCLIEKDTVFIDYTIYPCFAQGTEYKDYEKYGKKPTVDEPAEIEKVTGDIEISVRNKNLIKFAKEDWIGGYFNSDGTINNYGTTASTLIDSKYYVLPNNSNEFVLSFMPLKDFKLKRDAIAFYDKDKNPLSGVSLGLNDNFVFYKGTRAVIKKTINIPEGAKYFRFNLKWLQLQDNTAVNMYDEFYNYISELQLEVGTEATEYVPYDGTENELNLGDMELYKTTDCQDYIYKDKNKWYKHKELNNIIFDGTENLEIVNKETGYEDNTQTFTLKNIADMKDTNFNVVQKNVCCNWSLCGQYAARFLTRGIYKGIECGGRAIYVCLEKFKDYTLNEFKAYLAEQYENGTPLELVYELETPVDEEITDESLIAQLEALSKAKTSKKITHIDSVSNDLKPIIKMKYKKDLETIFNNFETRLNLLESEG